MITGDCGTSDLDAIAAAAGHGIEVIVVDHHTVPSADEPHPAFALVNPYRARLDVPVPGHGLGRPGVLRRRRGAHASSATAATIARAPSRTSASCSIWSRSGRSRTSCRSTAENRILTALGMRRLRRSSLRRARPGLAALLDAAGVDQDREVDARMVAWKLAPRINAPGRLGAAEPSLSLLLADETTAAERAAVLEAANTERRAIQDRVMTEALEQLGDRDPGPAMVLAGEGWPSGVVGIVAAKLVDRYHRPAFVDRHRSGHRGRAAARRGPREASICTRRWWPRRRSRAASGGSAVTRRPPGFTIDRSQVAALAEALGGACAELAAGSGPVPVGRDVDAEVRLAEVDERLATELAGLGPFGQHNPAPVLVTRNARVTQVRRVGDVTRGPGHLKLMLEDDRGTIRGAIGFGLGDREIEVGVGVDLAFVPTISTWQGRRSAELELADLAIVH